MPKSYNFLQISSQLQNITFFVLGDIKERINKSLKFYFNFFSYFIQKIKQTTLFLSLSENITISLSCTAKSLLFRLIN